MILSDGEIREAIKGKKITIDPTPSDSQYTSSALDIYLGEEILEQKTPNEVGDGQPNGVELVPIVDPSKANVRDLLHKFARPVDKEKDGTYVLKPNKFILGISREYIALPRESKIAARVEGRSSLARLGLVVHLTAPTIHAGFSGRIVLEMCNFGNYSLRLTPGKLAVCQLIFERLGRAPTKPPSTIHFGQKNITK